MLEFHGKSAASRKVDGMSAKRKVSVSIAKSYETDTSMRRGAGIRTRDLLVPNQAR
jgi:hypothetical protein